MSTRLAPWLAALLHVVRAAAAEPSDSNLDAHEPALSYWDEGGARPFVSAALALGAVSQLDAAAGFGKPHWMWAGVEPSALTTFDFGALAVGPRLAFVVADLSFKRRLTRAYAHAFLPRQSEYDASDIEDSEGAAAVYGAWDLSLWGVVPTPGGYGLYEFAGTWVDGVVADRDLFEEYQRVVMRGDQVLVVRLGWNAWIADRKGAIGLLGEWLSAEDRGQTWRVGPSFDFTLTDHLTASAVYTIPVAGVDALGPWTGAWGTLRLRYAWASGEPRPAFP